MKVRLSDILRPAAVLAAALVATVFVADGQNTRRKGAHKPRTVSETTVTAAADTISGAGDIAALASLGQYRKAAVSRVESVMITNLSACDTIHAMTVDIDYRDMAGRQLNRRTVELKANVPPGETRFVSFQSFDRQQLFYYHGTPPARPTARTTAFDVTLAPVRIVISK